MDFDNTKVTDTDLVHLTGLDRVLDLRLNNTDVTDAGLVHLKEMSNLRILSLTDTKVTDAGLVHLERLTDLETVYLGNTKVTDEGVKALQLALPKCRIGDHTEADTIAAIKELGGRVGRWEGHVNAVYFWDNKATDAGLEHLEELTKVEYLWLSGTQFTDAGLVHLERLTNLETVYLSNTKVTKDGVKRLQAAIPKCEISWK